MPPLPPMPPMPPISRWSRAYCWFCGLFLLVQGTTTLAARWWPAFDHAAPWLLRATHMQPGHSLLHVVSAALALAALAGRDAARAFAAAFGGFYLALGAVGQLSGMGFGLHLQPFDHPFHLLLGGLGLAAVWMDRRRPSRLLEG
jgi:hypothetical protein